MATRTSLRWVGLLACTADCSPDFSAALHVTIRGPQLPAGGGYFVEVRLPNGALIEGLSEQFVDYKAGSQDVTVLL